MPDSPFEFADTASARQQTTDLAMKLQHEKVAIVGWAVRDPLSLTSWPRRG